MSLYNKASIVLAPGAYKEGRIFNQKPLGESSDLKFDRGTSATEVTRVDNNSVIKESILLGSEVLVNGDFSSDSNWIKSGDVTIGGNNANFISSGDYIQQSITNPSSYRVILNVSSVTTSGAFRIRANNFAETTTITIDSTGEYVIDDPLTSNDGLVLQSDGFIGSISSVSVKQSFRDIPRINYLGDDGGYLLIEHESTNLITYSVDFNGSSWVTNNDITITDGFSSPDGGNNASKISTDPQASQSTKGILFSGYNTTNRLTDSRSIWAKTVSGTGQLHLLSHHSNTDNLFNITEEWQRFDLTGYNSTGANNFYAVDFRGSSTLTEVYLWGGQAEDNPFTTSYIPTSGGTATRAAETAINGGDSTKFNDDEGVLYIEAARVEGIYDSGTIGICDANADNSVFIKLLSTGVRVVIRGVNINEVIDNNVPNFDGFNKIAFQYKSGANKIFLNGSQLGSTDTTAWTTDAPKIKLNLDRGDGSYPFQGKIKCIAVFKETLTDTELQQLTS